MKLKNKLKEFWNNNHVSEKRIEEHEKWLSKHIGEDTSMILPPMGWRDTVLFELLPMGLIALFCLYLIVNLLYTVIKISLN